MSDGIVIVGGGLAAQRCCETLRAEGYDGPLRIVCAEDEPPYDRPPLSKELLAGSTTESALAFRPAAWYEGSGIDLLLGTRAEHLDPGARRLFAAGCPPLRYERLLLATGSRPRTLPGFDGGATLRTLGDARALSAALGPGTRLVVIGAGFIGLEVAATARGLGADVTIVDAAPAPLAAALGDHVGFWFAELHRTEGVEVVAPARIAAASARHVKLEDGTRIDCDRLLVAIGCRPDTDWLRSSGLALEDGGVPVDDAQRAAAPDVFAAGDAALALDPFLGRRARSEHWEAAATGGAAAARAMLGLDPGPRRLPSFWSDQYGVRVQCVGHPREADGLEVDGHPSSRDFTALFTRAGRPVAALLVGRSRALAAARRTVQAGIDSMTPERSIR